nr:hypothetical protein CFP56_05514 [Quercus suber]
MVCFQENCFYGGLHKLLSLENNTNQEEEINNLYEVIFKRFDKDVKGFIDRMEFESLIRELMLAMARGIGDLPVLVALEEHSLLMKAVQHEVASLKEVGDGGVWPEMVGPEKRLMRKSLSVSSGSGSTPLVTWLLSSPSCSSVLQCAKESSDGGRSSCSSSTRSCGSNGGFSLLMYAWRKD